MYPGDQILVVEDDADHFTLIAEGFKRARISNCIIHAESAEEALAYLKGEGKFQKRELHPFPCLVLLDLHLPGESGFTVLQWVRNHSTFRKLPVVVLTASTADADIERAYALGANSYLAKPFKVEELKALIKSIDAFWVLLAQKPRF